MQRGFEPRLHQTQLLGALLDARLELAARSLKLAQRGFVRLRLAPEPFVDLRELPRRGQPHEAHEPIAE
jgi:hypothetical protein